MIWFLLQFGVLSAFEFFKDNKLHLPYALVQFCCLSKKLLVLINTKLHSKSCYYLYKTNLEWGNLDVSYQGLDFTKTSLTVLKLEGVRLGQDQEGNGAFKPENKNSLLVSMVITHYKNHWQDFYEKGKATLILSKLSTLLAK